MIRWLCNYRAGKKRSPASDCVTQAFHINKDRKKLNVNLLPLLSFFLTENNSPKEHQHRKLPRKHSQFATFIKIDCDLSTQLRAPAVMLQIGTLHKKFMRKLQLIEPEQREGERGEVRTWAQQRYQLSAGWMSDSEKSWHAPLRLQNNGCLINTFLALVRFWTAPASCLLKGLATQIWVMCCVENIWTWCDIIPPPTLRRRRKIWLMCWKLKYVSQFPSCLSLTNDPPFTFLSWPTWGSSQSRRQQIYAIPPRWQPWNPWWQNCGGAIQNKTGLMLLWRGDKTHRSSSVESSYRDHAGVKTPVIWVCHKQQMAIASLSTLLYRLLI